MASSIPLLCMLKILMVLIFEPIIGMRVIHHDFAKSQLVLYSSISSKLPNYNNLRPKVMNDFQKTNAKLSIVHTKHVS